MEKQNITQTFKKAQIDLQEGKLYEHADDGIRAYDLDEILSVFQGEKRFIDITIKEATELGNFELDSSLD